MKSVAQATHTPFLRTACVLLCLAISHALAAESAPEPEPDEKPAELKVSGYGLFGNLRLKRTLRILQPTDRKPRLFRANFVEDAALLLISRLRDEGYLEPVITAEVTFDDGTQSRFVWDESVEEPLPRPFRARKVRFVVKEGVLFHFDDLAFSGLTAIPQKRARDYFIETGGLLRLKRNRIYSPDRFKRGLENLEAELQRLGYTDATVTAEDLERNPRSGAVNVTIRVVEGPKYIVRSIREQVLFSTNDTPAAIRTNYPGKTYSKFWEQDFIQLIRTNFYRQGYPDTTVEITPTTRHSASNRIELDLVAVTRPGPRVRTGDVSFDGNERTKESVLRSRVPLHEGDWLDRVKAEQGRQRIARLGIFDSVELRYEPVDEHTRNVTYQVDEGKRVDVSLLFGYGSYELLRGGVQIDHFNVLGRGHHSRFRVAQSFKSSSGDYTYTMPEFFGEDIDMFFTASGLRREEVSFTRVEYGGGAGVRKVFRRIDTDVSLRYNYEILRATDADVDLTGQGVQNSGVAAMIGDINHDKRDNPLYPHRGYKLFSNVELASEYLGGEVNYQRLDLNASWHIPISGAQRVHLGFSHGFVATAGSPDKDLPFNRRFFPGGENSIRGYQEGEASPRNADGDFVGAETYLLGNVEFEQGLTPRWSIVTFVDALGYARQLENYPLNHTLISVGAGIRWKTFIGPVRLEYGYNVTPRDDDPTGTLHFSLGFPF